MFLIFNSGSFVKKSLGMSCGNLCLGGAGLYNVEICAGYNILKKIL